MAVDLTTRPPETRPVDTAPSQRGDWGSERSDSDRGDWAKVQRPAYRAEEGAGDSSDWATLLKSALVVMLAVAGLTALLSGLLAQ